MNTDLLVTSPSTECVAEEVNTDKNAPVAEMPLLLEEIHFEKITIDGICGVY